MNEEQMKQYQIEARQALMNQMKLQAEKANKKKKLKKDLAFTLGQKVQIKMISEKLAEHIESEMISKTARVRGYEGRVREDDESELRPPEDPNGIYITPRKPR